MADTPFEVAAERVDSEEIEWHEFNLPGIEETLRARQPSEGQVTLIMARMTSNKSEKRLKGYATLINVFMEMLDEDSADLVEDTLMEIDSGLSGEHLVEKWYDLVEEWSGRPTKRPSGSTSSPPATGKKSTARARAKGSTSSRSRSTGS